MPSRPHLPPPPSPLPAARVVRRWWPGPVRLAMVLGSGFNTVRERLAEARALPCRRLPGCPVPAVEGHAGEWVWGRLGPLPVLLLAGRAHAYEGWPLPWVAQPMRVLAQLGVEAVVLTNAAGGIRRSLRRGSFMLLSDHINAMGANPLCGPVPRGCERFIDLSAVYDRALRHLFKQAARQQRIPLAEGVYLAVTGPSYETPAEIRAFARLGADAIGMSSVPEAIVARQCGLAVAGLSCITNPAAGRHPGALSHEEVLAAGRHAGERAGALLEAFATLYARGPRPRTA